MTVVISGEPGRSTCCHRWQLDDGIIAQLRAGFQTHVPTALNSPLVILLEQQGPDKSGDGAFIEEDADNIGCGKEKTEGTEMEGLVS